MPIAKGKKSSITKLKVEFIILVKIMKKMIDKFFTLPGWLLFLVSSTFIAISMMWGALSGSETERPKSAYLAEPSEHVGDQLCLGYLKIQQKNSGHVIGQDNSGNSYPLFLPADIRVNEGGRYSVKGIVNNQGIIEIHEIQHHPFRSYKYIFSSLSLIVVLVILFRYIRINRDGLQIHYHKAISVLNSSTGN